jgi:filamentous hemagglutinin
MLGEFAAARILSTAVVKELVLKRTGASITDDAAARLANNFYRDGIDATAWTVGKAGSMENNAITHWTKHGAEFPEFPSFAQYTEAAQNFVVNPPLGAQSFIRANGERLIYDPIGNTFAVSTAEGVPKTMFRPADGINYWLKQIK